MINHSTRRTTHAQEAASIVVVTGAFGSLGTAIADRFANSGHRVARIDFAPAPIGVDLAFGGFDLADPTAASAAISQVVEAVGIPGILINVAGGFRWETLADGDLSTWERMFRINAMTAASMCKAALPMMMGQSGAAIVNIGATAAYKADAGMGPYAASKAAVAKLTESLAAELSGTDLTVNAILPTIIDTPTNRADMPDQDFSQWVSAADIAEVAVFLASSAARSMSGACIPVSRGTAAYRT